MKIFLLAFLASSLYAVTPDCQTKFTVTNDPTIGGSSPTVQAPGSSTAFLNVGGTVCTAWTLIYTSTGFTQASLQFEESTAPTGPWTSWPGQVLYGQVPFVVTSSNKTGYINLLGTYNYVRLTMPFLTGVGTVYVQLYGWVNPANVGSIVNYPSQGGSATPIGSAGGILAGSYPNPSAGTTLSTAITQAGTALQPGVGTTVNGQSCIINASCTIMAVPSGLPATAVIGSNSGGAALDITGAVQQNASHVSILRDIPSVINYGAYGDYIMLSTLTAGTRCSISGTGVLTCATASFVAADAVAPAKVACIENWSASLPVCIAIQSVTDSTHVQLASSPPGGAFSGAVVGYGHDDTTAFQNAGNAGSFQVPARSQTVSPVGFAGYLVNGNVAYTSPLRIYGEGAEVRIFSANTTTATPVFQLDFTNPGNGNTKMGIDGIGFYGSAALGGANSTFMLQFGGTNGCTNCILDNDSFFNNALAFETAEKAFYNRIRNFFFFGNTTAYRLTTYVSGGGESIEFDGGAFQFGGDASTDTSACIQIQGNANVTFKNLSMIACGASGTAVGGFASFDKVHMEAGGLTGLTNPYFTLTGSMVIAIKQPQDMLVGTTGGTGPQYFATINNGAAVLDIEGNGSVNDFQFVASSPVLVQNTTGSVIIRNTILRPTVSYLSTTTGYTTYVDPTPLPDLTTTATTYTAAQNTGQVFCIGGTTQVNLPAIPWPGEKITVTNIGNTTCTISANGQNIYKSPNATAASTAVLPTQSSVIFTYQFFGYGGWFTTPNSPFVPGTGLMGTFGDSNSAATFVVFGGGTGRAGVGYNPTDTSLYLASSSSNGVEICPSTTVSGPTCSTKWANTGTVSKWNSETTAGIGVPYALYSANRTDTTTPSAITLLTGLTGTFKVNVVSDALGSICTNAVSLGFTSAGGAQTPIIIAASATGGQTSYLLDIASGNLTLTPTIVGTCTGGGFKTFIQVERKQ